MRAIEEFLTADYIKFLKKKVVVLGSKNQFEDANCFFKIKKFYNLSDISDLVDINTDYEGRFDKKYFIIADTDNGDYLLMNKAGEVLFWNHELNDMGYDKDSEEPILLSKNITSFLKKLTKETEIEIEPEVISIKVSKDFHERFKDYLK